MKLGKCSFFSNLDLILWKANWEPLGAPWCSCTKVVFSFCPRLCCCCCPWHLDPLSCWRRNSRRGDSSYCPVWSLLAAECLQHFMFHHQGEKAAAGDALSIVRSPEDRAELFCVGPEIPIWVFLLLVLFSSFFFFLPLGLSSRLWNLENLFILASLLTLWGWRYRTWGYQFEKKRTFLLSSVFFIHLFVFKASLATQLGCTFHSTHIRHPSDTLSFLPCVKSCSSLFTLQLPPPPRSIKGVTAQRRETRQRSSLPLNKTWPCLPERGS